MEITFTVVPPFRQLTPNSRRLHVAKSGMTAMYRQLVAVQARAAHQKAGSPAFRGRVVVDLELLQPTVPLRQERGLYYRPRDEDNLRGAFKAGQDGLVDSRIVSGDDRSKITIGSTKIRTERGVRPQLIVTLRDEEDTTDGPAGDLDSP